jgi:hypothetical protein
MQKFAQVVASDHVTVARKAMIYVIGSITGGRSSNFSKIRICPAAI